MNIRKVISLIILAVFLFSSAGFCDVVSSPDDDGQHCVSCCSAGCHSIDLSSQLISIDTSLSRSFVSFDAVLRQEPFLSGIEYPPNSII